jgi:hypothetical protein
LTLLCEITKRTPHLTDHFGSGLIFRHPARLPLIAAGRLALGHAISLELRTKGRNALRSAWGDRHWIKMDTVTKHKLVQTIGPQRIRHQRWPHLPSRCGASSPRCRLSHGIGLIFFLQVFLVLRLLRTRHHLFASCWRQSIPVSSAWTRDPSAGRSLPIIRSLPLSPFALAVAPSDDMLLIVTLYSVTSDVKQNYTASPLSRLWRL